MITVTLSGGSHGGETADFDETQTPSRVRLPLRPGYVEVYELRSLDGAYHGIYTGVEAE